MKRLITLLFIIFLTSGICSAQTDSVYVTINGKPITSNGKIVKIAIDADAQTYINSIDTADGTLTLAQKLKVNWLFKTLKANGYYAKMLGLYPLKGANAVSASINAVSPGGGFNVIWNNATDGEFDAKGWTNDGNGWGETNIIPSTHITSLDASSMGLYSLTNLGGAVVDMGVSDAVADKYWSFTTRSSTNTAVFRSYKSAATSASYSDSQGFWTLSRSSSTSAGLCRNGVAIVTSATPGGALPTTYDIWLGGLNNAGSVTGRTSKKYALFYVYNGALTNSDCAKLYTIFNIFQQAF